MPRFVFFNFSELEKATVLNDTFLISKLKELSKTVFKSFLRKFSREKLNKTKHDIFFVPPFMYRIIQLILLYTCMPNLTFLLILTEKKRVFLELIC